VTKWAANAARGERGRSELNAEQDVYKALSDRAIARLKSVFLGQGVVFLANVQRNVIQEWKAEDATFGAALEARVAHAVLARQQHATRSAAPARCGPCIAVCEAHPAIVAGVPAELVVASQRPAPSSSAPDAAAAARKRGGAAPHRAVRNKGPAQCSALELPVQCAASLQRDVDVNADDGRVRGGAVQRSDEGACEKSDAKRGRRRGGRVAGAWNQA